MDFKHFLGIDVSKLTLDLCLITAKNELLFFDCANNKKALQSCLKTIFKDQQLLKEEVLICAESTGHYSNILCETLIIEQFSFWLADPYDIKLSQGIQRGKSDKKDAERIGIYAKRYADKARLMKSSLPIFKQLAYLVAERDLLVVDKAKYTAQLKDEKNFFDKLIYDSKKKRYTPLIKKLKATIEEIEKQISDLIKSDENLNNQFEIITSIDGVGPQTAINTIIKTEGFTKINEAKKFACHAGCAPFNYSSGTSVRSADRVSKKADGKLKKLLHMSALSAVKMQGEFKVYFARKVAEGKNKMSVINAVRNKIISRIFALIHQNRKYEKNYINTIV